MMEEISHNTLENQKKAFHKSFLINAVILNLLYLLIYVISANMELVYTQIILTIIPVTTYIIISSYDYNLKKATFYYAIFYIILHFIIAMLLWKNSLIIYAWFIVFPLVIYVVATVKETLYFSLIITILIIISPFISNYFELAVSSPFTPFLKTVNDITTIISCLSLIINCIYFISLTNDTKIKIENYHTYVTSKKGYILPVIMEEKLSLDSKQENALRIIKEYFEKEKPYRDPKFNIYSLTYETSLNMKMISKTLNIVDEQGFTGFVNKYKINYVLKQLEEGAYKGYTLASIYTEAGFTQQSTFNRVFKQQIGVSPSQYIKKLNKDQI